MSNTKENLMKVNFSSRSKEELSRINSQSGNKSKGAIMRWMKLQNPMLAHLMDSYRTMDKLQAVENFVSDIEKLNKLFNEAKTINDKLKIINSLSNIKNEANKFIFGTRSENVNVNANLDANASDFAERVLQRIVNKDKEEKLKLQKII